MTPEIVMSLGFQAIKIGLLIAAPLLLASLVAGLVVSILQASTQINEMTLSFIPKILVLVVVVIALGPWMMEIFLDYMHTLFSSIPYLIR
ncbi:Flagellar biosynthetic protein FliQ [Enterobacter sp. DC4]|uniref:flagellar biosynthesis protein FliQ n=1 Tax=Enterobacter sp. DC4 TaxID=1395580 RepID=UPI0003ECFC06|nr:flagellar biosynthesis protein FliQ [Enterobacter sp. DC4]EWG67272.1 Flagellar biosynthetic protein FliQ [Enterobacter sp. DC4]